MTRNVKVSAVSVTSSDSSTGSGTVSIDLNGQPAVTLSNGGNMVTTTMTTFQAFKVIDLIRSAALNAGFSESTDASTVESSKFSVEVKSLTRGFKVTLSRKDLGTSVQVVENGYSTSTKNNWVQAMDSLSHLRPSRKLVH